MVSLQRVSPIGLFIRKVNLAKNRCNMNEAASIAYETVQAIIVSLLLIFTVFGICVSYVITDMRAAKRKQSSYLVVLLDMIGFGCLITSTTTIVTAGAIYIMVYLRFAQQHNTRGIPVVYWVIPFIIGILLMAWSIYSSSKKR